jgi:putative NADPH-quinone reductase
MATGTRHVVLVQGHPDPQHRHFCHALADSYAAGARGARHEVMTVDVARLDFPLARSREDLESGPTPEAIREVQDALTRADHVVLFYPVWTGAMPALLKGFLEQTSGRPSSSPMPSPMNVWDSRRTFCRGKH